MSNCHCSQRRKAYGASFGTIAVVSKSDFDYVSGQDMMSARAQELKADKAP